MIVRSACACGMDGIILQRQGCAQIGPLGIKASTGSLFRMRLIDYRTLGNKIPIQRANSARDHLISHGIAASRITAKGYGEQQLVASNDTDAGRAQNRRVELRFQ